MWEEWEPLLANLIISLLFLLLLCCAGTFWSLYCLAVIRDAPLSLIHNWYFTAASLTMICYLLCSHFNLAVVPPLHMSWCTILICMEVRLNHRIYIPKGGEALSRCTYLWDILQGCIYTFVVTLSLWVVSRNHSRAIGNKYRDYEPKYAHAECVRSKGKWYYVQLWLYICYM